MGLFDAIFPSDPGMIVAISFMELVIALATLLLGLPVLIFPLVKKIVHNAIDGLQKQIVAASEIQKTDIESKLLGGVAPPSKQRFVYHLDRTKGTRSSPLWVCVLAVAIVLAAGVLWHVTPSTRKPSRASKSAKDTSIPKDVLNKLLAKVRDIVVEQLGVNPEQVTMQARFIEDLGADSLDTVELVMAGEEEFGIEITDEDAERLQTVGDVVHYIYDLLGEKALRKSLNIPTAFDLSPSPVNSTPSPEATLPPVKK